MKLKDSWIFLRRNLDYLTKMEISSLDVNIIIIAVDCII